MVEQQPRRVRRTVFIGLGGTGNEIVRRIKREMLTHGYNLPLFQYLVLDTVSFEEAPGMDEHMQIRNGEEYLYIGGYNPNEVLKHLENWPIIGRWWGNRNTTNLVTVDEGAGQMRSVGRMGFFYHFHAIEAQFQRIAFEITNATNRQQARAQNYEISGNSPIIYVIFSLCGGTGSSLFFDVAYVMRHLLKFTEKPIVVGIALMPGPYVNRINSRPQKTRLQANAYAALTELERLHNMAMGIEPRPDGRNLWNVDYSTNFQVASPELPFDYIYLVDNVTAGGETYDIDRVYTTTARTIFWLTAPPTAGKFWERAKNLSSKTLSSGGRTDNSGQKRFSIYSSFGSSTIKMDWSIERVRAILDNKVIDHIRQATPQRPQFLAWLTGPTTLFESVTSEQPAINPFPPDKALRPTGTYSNEIAIDEELEEYTVQYETALNNILRSPTWQRIRNKYKNDLWLFIDTHIRESLCTRGPIAVQQEIVSIDERLSTLLAAIQEEAQKSNEDAARRQTSYEETRRLPRAHSQVELIGRAILEMITRIYILRAFRRQNTPEELRNIAESKAHQRHLWYNARFHALLYKDVADTIIKPALVYLSERKALLADVDEMLEARQSRNLDKLKRPRNIRREQMSMDMLRPRHDEQKQVTAAQDNGLLHLERSIITMQYELFEDWPRMSGEVKTMLETAMNETVQDMLTSLDNAEHILERMTNNGRDVLKQRTTFLQGAECLWNITTDTDQELTAHVETIDLLGFGADPYQQISTEDLADLAQEELFRNYAAKPECIPTDFSTELGYIKTSHGVLISSIRYIHELQRAYHEMSTLRNAPYLHIDYSDAVRKGYSPLVATSITYREIITEWEEVADRLENYHSTIGREVRTTIHTYRWDLQQLASPPDEDERVVIGEPDDPIFELILKLREIILPLQQTPALADALMKLVDFNILLATQGWMECVPPELHSPYDAHSQEIRKEVRLTSLPPGQVIFVVMSAYQHRSSNMFRKAGVFVSVDR
ncbi:hypothetical protein KSF_038710 [Reticulibacter mediterranei]|uniref:Tubulin like n=1 Tax=Reticulibacter mediterranei TaxID=2778369 RepID=A0A8J3IJX5_9CHLR|nr:tubulin-like doman-containing protein [Reticulibacter mediterranei]GHO93823.1 hypothetical protein KSF_038710 [Reticulibacter mediterranei]